MFGLVSVLLVFVSPQIDMRTTTLCLLIFAGVSSCYMEYVCVCVCYFTLRNGYSCNHVINPNINIC